MADLVRASGTTVLSLNVMAPEYVRGNLLGAESERPRWLSRVSQLVEFLKAIDPDLTLLQEVPLETFEEDFAAYLETRDHYRHHPQKKRTSRMGNVIVWRRGHLVPVIKVWTSASVVVGFRDLGLVVNVHLKAGYNSGRETRANQLTSILKVSDGALPDRRIVMGDFNDDLYEPDERTSRLLEGLEVTRFGPTVVGREFDLAVLKGVTLTETRSVEWVGEPLSDHLPIWGRISRSPEGRGGSDRPPQVTSLDLELGGGARVVGKDSGDDVLRGQDRD